MSDLIPGGSDTDVTSENFEEYLKAQVLWRLGGGFTDLLEHFIRGRCQFDDNV